uniref:Uncharacterized protein n=1 Tax=Schizaphis graminum TaxID=13262 RepID=A0A2S2NEU5_SCHGA
MPIFFAIIRNSLKHVPKALVPVLISTFVFVAARTDASTASNCLSVSSKILVYLASSCARVKDFAVGHDPAAVPATWAAWFPLTAWPVSLIRSENTVITQTQIRYSRESYPKSKYKKLVKYCTG